LPRTDDAAAARGIRGIGEVIGRFRGRFSGIDETRIQGVVNDCQDAFRGRPMRDFVPILVERPARAEFGRTSAG